MSDKDKLLPKYKMIKQPVPHCPLCDEKLKGNNSRIDPFRCSCGVWKQVWDDFSFTIESEE
jgi:hypothetical protein